MKLPNFRTYVNYSSDNYGIHALVFYVDGRAFYFSYETLIAFTDPNGKLVIRENDWGTTTGKHLNAIDSDKNKRVTGTRFEQLYEQFYGDK